jgi:hypothetical protein
LNRQPPPLEIPDFQTYFFVTVANELQIWQKSAFFCTVGKFEWLEVLKEKLLQKRNLQQSEKAVSNWHRSFFA